MEKPTPNPEHHQHHAHHSSEHELSADNQQPPDYENRDFGSPLAQPPLTNPPPTHQLEQDQNAPPQPQPQQQHLQSLPLQSLQSQSAPVVCPACGVRAMTITTEESGGFVHAIAALVCFFTCCGCIPYCISSLKDVHHQCGNCKMPIADYHRSGRTEVLAYQK
ncbi:LITAF-like zinc ribbon domain-containing protein [Fusarium redolens]|uniref:LITAF-like zinc ribbon domain-containing protein n=1 Tax=Fusarium redolens TaxID=48865 RepID=A0A9P9HCZ9_FUSRE|nr:LITAF-like zinc ribbon domain-containing protein [Fusarium redolens]KAH7255273.1 LITAF-like zinc ribbon domain-containing protein [Fusarium redolens]